MNFNLTVLQTFWYPARVRMLKGGGSSAGLPLAERFDVIQLTKLGCREPVDGVIRFT
jgi:hypothetical protein